MKTLKLISLTAIIFIICIAVFGFQQVGEQKPDKQQRIEANRDFNKKYDNKWIIQINEITGTPSIMRGDKITKYNGKPEQIAKEFLTEEKKCLALKTLKQM